MATHAGSLRALLASALVVFGTLGVASDPAVASVCGDRVVADWIDGRVDGVYPLRCYEEAVDGLPEDVRVYSSAVDDISRALQARVHSRARAAAGKPGSAVVPASVDTSAARPPLALLLLVAFVCLFGLAGAGTWIVQSRRRRA